MPLSGPLAQRLCDATALDGGPCCSVPLPGAPPGRASREAVQQVPRGLILAHPRCRSRLDGVDVPRRAGAPGGSSGSPSGRGG